MVINFKFKLHRIKYCMKSSQENEIHWNPGSMRRDSFGHLDFFV